MAVPEGIALPVLVSVRTSVPAVRAAMTPTSGAASFAGTPTAQAGQRLGDGFGRVDLFGGHDSILHAT